MRAAGGTSGSGAEFPEAEGAIRRRYKESKAEAVEGAGSRRRRASRVVRPKTRQWVDWRDASSRHRRRVAPWRRLTAPQLFVGSFLLLIASGTCGLRWLPGLYTGKPLGWLDALFTSTSAVCVTGLIVVDTATVFTRAGQAWILLLIQLGGLGIITFTTLIVAMLGRRLSLAHEAISASVSDIAPHVDYRTLARDVVLFTFGIEALGAVLLTLAWWPVFGFREALWYGVFHSISAFCNAGFSTFSDSLISYRDSSMILLVVGLLIVAGGIGFLTLEELYQSLKARRQGRFFRMSLQSRVILLTTGILIVGGWAPFVWLEWDNVLDGLSIWGKLVNGLFMSITPRTAGFNSMDYAQASDSTNFLTILLMFIGGSPGSTAGGVKTTTVALLGLLAFSRFRGRNTSDLWGRTVPEQTIQRAVGLSVASFTLVTFCLLILTTAEGGGGRSPVRDSFLKYMFEAVSAYNTVGLSMGVTATLTVASKSTLILLMFLGRVGLTTAAAALVLARPDPAGEFRYAYEDVVVG